MRVCQRLWHCASCSSVMVVHAGHSVQNCASGDYDKAGAETGVIAGHQRRNVSRSLTIQCPGAHLEQQVVVWNR